MNRILNWKRTPEDPRDLKFSPRKLFAKPLPQKVDWTLFCSPVVDQGDLGSCTANALVSGVREFMLLKAKQPLERLSRLFLYYQERVAEGTPNEDSGAYLKDGLDCLLKLGVCREKLDPYITEHFNEPPTQEEINDASNYKIKKYMRVQGISNVKAALASGKILAAGMDVFNQMMSDQAARTGVVSMPSYNENPIGGHAVTVVGYINTPRTLPGYWKGGGYLIVRNSWGPDWGLKGYFKVAYDYVNYGFMPEFWAAE